MNALNQALTSIFDAFLGGLVGLSPALTLILVSVVSGILAASAFRFLSNQRQMKQIADHSRARLLAIRLFPDDLAGIFTSLGGLIGLSLKRFLYSLPSLLVLGPLFVIVLVQLAAWYEYRPLADGDSAIVTAQIDPDEKRWAALQDATLEVPAGVRVETPALRDEQSHTISWRIGVESASSLRSGAIRFVADDEVFEKQLVLAPNGATTAAATPVSHQRPGAGFFDRLIHPREAGFARDSPVRGILIDYPENPARSIAWGFGWPWWVLFLIISMAAAFAAQPLIGVKF